VPAEPQQGREKNRPGEPVDHALGRSRGGFSTKLHLLVDARGLPLVVEVTPGQQHESTCFESVVQAVRIRQSNGNMRWRPRRLAGDKGYSYPRIRTWLREHRIEAVIPQRDDQRTQHRGRPLKFDRDAYRQRNAVECCVGWLKENRRVAVRYEKLATNYLGMLKLAMLKRYLPVFPNRA
jgi:transposase